MTTNAKALEAARRIKAAAATRNQVPSWSDMEFVAEALLAAAPSPAAAPGAERVVHFSDCAIYNAPALPVGPCDCGADKDPCIVLRRALHSAVRYMRDAGAFMEDFPEIKAALAEEKQP